MSITSDFSKFKKIDAHSHIGTFGVEFVKILFVDFLN